MTDITCGMFTYERSLECMIGSWTLGYSRDFADCRVEIPIVYVTGRLVLDAGWGRVRGAPRLSGKLFFVEEAGCEGGEDCADPHFQHPA